MFDTETGNRSPSYSLTVPWDSTQTLMQVPYLPPTSWHPHNRSSGIPSSFPLQTAALTVDGSSQSSAAACATGTTRRARTRPRSSISITRPAIFSRSSRMRREAMMATTPSASTLSGWAELVRYMLGTMPEAPESILTRVANDPSSPDFNIDQVPGKYFFAETAADVGPAFQALQNEIIRLSK